MSFFAAPVIGAGAFLGTLHANLRRGRSRCLEENFSSTYALRRLDFRQALADLTFEAQKIIFRARGALERALRAGGGLPEKRRDGHSDFADVREY